MVHEYPRPVVAYLRVSTEMQDVESQWVVIQEWARKNSVSIDERLVEKEPTSGAEDKRPVFQELWLRVKERRVGTVVVAELSRLSRRMRTLVNFLYDCVESGVHVVSIRESWLSEALENEMTRPIIVSMISVLYELERKIISERTKAGLQRVKALGKHVGRPLKLRPEEVLEAVKLYTGGTPISEIARKLKTHKSTIYRYLKRYGVIKVLSD